jgi:tetratricopeptide (TPR) repeat protein
VKKAAVLFLIASAISLQAQTKKGVLAQADSLFLAGDSKSARALYGKILKDTSQNAGAWSRFGFADLNLKNFDQALRHFEKALELKPAANIRMNIFAGLARTYSMKNNNAKALASFDSAISLGYSNLKLVDTNEDLKNIREDLKFKEIRNRLYNRLFPCMTNPKAREFDFWVGEWDVFVTGTKNYAGHSKIEMVSGGCALLENWDSNSSSGKSLNFIDPITNKWRQTWVGSYAYGTQDFTDGEYKDAAMRFVFEGTHANGQKFIGRFMFFNEKPGQVRQFNETSADGGKTWVTSYDFTYLRKQ